MFEPELQKTSAKTYWVPFVLALLTFQAFIILHELGHYLPLAFLGLNPEFHYTKIVLQQGTKITYQADILFASGGPLMNAFLGILGLLWLGRLRSGRIDSSPTILDWIATCLAINLGRSLRGFSGMSSNQLSDEAYVSRAFGLPPWMLPCVLGAVAVGALFITIRLHPPGRRLLPFASLIVGGTIGVTLWTKVIGPLAFP